MYNPQKRITSLNETFQERMPWGTLITHQGAQRLLVLDRICNKDESLQSIGVTAYGLVVQPGDGFIKRGRTGWESAKNKPSGNQIGTAPISPADSPLKNWNLEAEEDYYIATVSGTFSKFASNIGYHNIEGYYYRQYNPTEDYDVGEIVYHEGIVYVCENPVSPGPPDFPYADFHELTTGGMYSDKQSHDVTADEYYELAKSDASTSISFNLSFNADHILHCQINTSGHLHIISSSWTTQPYITELHVDSTSGVHSIVFKAKTSEIGLIVKQNGFSLIEGNLVEPNRPIKHRISLSAKKASIYHIDKSSGSFSDGAFYHEGPSYYIDKDGNAVDIDPVNDLDSTLVNMKYVNTELAKKRTLVALFDPNNVYGWVDSDGNVIPPTTVLNNGYYYLTSANSKVSISNVSTDIKYSGSNAALNTEFIITGDETANFNVAGGRCFLKSPVDPVNPDKNIWYSVNYASAVFAGGNTTVTLTQDVTKPVIPSTPTELYTFVAWPSYFSNKHLPPIGVGLLSNDTIISTGTKFSPGPPPAGGWKLIRTGVESVAERIMKNIHKPGHGFTTGQLIYIEHGPTHAGGNTTAAPLVFTLTPSSGDLTAMFAAGTNIILMKTGEAKQYTTQVASSVYAANQTAITLLQQAGLDPDDDFDLIYTNEQDWRLAQADKSATLKIAMAWYRSNDDFWAVYYGLVPFENRNAKEFEIGKTYYLSTTVPGAFQTTPPSNAGEISQPVFIPVEFVDDDGDGIGDWIIKVIDEAGDVITSFQNAQYTAILAQGLDSGVGIADFVYQVGAVWKKAIATSEATRATGYVAVTGGSGATIATGGNLPSTGHGIGLGKQAFLSATTPGGFSATLDAAATVDQKIFTAMTPDIIRIFDSSGEGGGGGLHFSEVDFGVAGGANFVPFTITPVNAVEAVDFTITMTRHNVPLLNTQTIAGTINIANNKATVSIHNNFVGGAVVNKISAGYNFPAKTPPNTTELSLILRIAATHNVDINAYAQSRTDTNLTIKKAFTFPSGNPSVLVEIVDLNTKQGFLFSPGAGNPDTGGGGDTTTIGTIDQSFLTEAQHNAASGNTDWVLCDGRDVTGSEYHTLTGLTKVPDLRGAYLRMAGTNSTNATWIGGAINNYWEDKTKRPANAFTTNTMGNHYHSLGFFEQERQDMIQQYGNITAANATAGVNSPSFQLEDGHSGNAAEGSTSEKLAASSSEGNHSHTINGGGDVENRPKTYTVNYFVKINSTNAVLTTTKVDPVTVSATAPAPLAVGQMWLDSGNGDFYVLTNNPPPGSATDNWQWLQINI